MFRAKTVLIVGAGASEEFGFPLGAALLRDVADRVDISYEFNRLKRGDHIVADALRNALSASTNVEQFNNHLHSAWQLVKSSKQAISIDNVLDALEDENASRVGKFGIVRSILVSEESSSLSKWIDHFPKQIEIDKFSHTWLGIFANSLTEGRKKSEINSIFNNITIINFNYDRIIEHYLPYAIANYYGLSPAEIREVMPLLPIFRPYGKAGTLPWEGKEGPVPFGHCSAHDIEVAAGQILTFTEQVENQNLVSGIKNAIKEADRIVFIGFGYHRQNLAMLSSPSGQHVEIRGTSFGMSDSDTISVSNELEDIFGLEDKLTYNGHSYARLLPLKCANFMSDIWRTLTSEPGKSPVIELSALPEQFR